MDPVTQMLLGKAIDYGVSKYRDFGNDEQLSGNSAPTQTPPQAEM